MNLTACVTLNTTQFIRLEELPLNHFQKPHQRKQGDHISCRGSPGIPLLLFLHSRSQVTHCFDWQDFQHWAQGLLKPSSFFQACLTISQFYCLPCILYKVSRCQDTGHHLIHSSSSSLPFSTTDSFNFILPHSSMCPYFF